jgi:hypothetical protein
VIFGPELLSRRQIVHAGNHQSGCNLFVPIPQNLISGIFQQANTPFHAGVKLMIACHGPNSQSRVQFLEHLSQGLDSANISVHQIARNDNNIRFHLVDPVDQIAQPPPAQQISQMQI